jgi:hypothetical protein
MLVCATLCTAQTPVVLAPVPQLQFFTQTGLPLAFGCVFTNQSQTANPLSTYTDFTGQWANQNPVKLSAGGSANIWIKAGQAYTFIVKSSGGTNCALGSTLYTIDGIGGGLTTLTTVVTPSGGSATFTDQSQVQLFTLLLTGNVVGQPITAVGIIPPGLITFQITQDGVGSRTFSWPANTVGGATICATANCVTTQTFMWNGTNATAIGLATYSSGPASAATDLYDFGLSASLPICTDANKKLTSTCTGLIPNSALQNSSVTYNGQAVALGAAGNVNAGAAAHSVAVNEGAGAAIGGVALTDDQALVGVTGADPAPKALCNGNLNYNTSTHVYFCPSSMNIVAAVSFTTCVPNAGNSYLCTATQAWGVTISGSYNIQCSWRYPPGVAVPNADGAIFFWDVKNSTNFTYFWGSTHSGINGAATNVDCIATQ